jgi:hypothetical protein
VEAVRALLAPDAEEEEKRMEKEHPRDEEQEKKQGMKQYEGGVFPRLAAMALLVP